jgi:RsiW-degrading membrane proteinase PrsW (M82 family)
MEFKKLELESEKNLIKRVFNTPHAKRTVISIIIGAIVGFGYFYFSEGRHLNEIVVGDIIKSVFVGGFFGFFITNSPCARNKC